MGTTEIEVDLWKTGVHKVEIGIKKQEEYRSKSRQYTADTDIIGEYKSDKTKGYVTIREDPWKVEDKGKQRLILKTYTESMNWKGSMEELVALSTSRSIAAQEGLAVFTLNLSNYDRLVTLERLFKPRSMNKAMFTFMFVEDETFVPYHIEADRLTLGSDWTVFDQHDNKVAEIDGSKFNIGGKWKIKINDKYDHHPAFDEVLILFSAFVKFEEEVRNRLEENAKKIKDKKKGFKVTIPPEEVDLYDNPRRTKV